MNKINSKKLLLIDGLGALLTATMHGFILTKLVGHIGMPIAVLIPLAILAAAYSIFSLFSYFLVTKNWWKNLRFVAFANLFFCFISGVMVFKASGVLSGLGMAYFIGEIILISLLVFFELRVASRDATSS